MPRFVHCRPLMCVSAVIAGFLISGISGCQTPFEPLSADRDFRAAVERVIERELADAPAAEDRVVTTQPPGEAEDALAERRDELDALTPAMDRRERRFDLGPDLTGRPQAEVSLSLQEAIASAVRHNLAIQAARLQPAINEADVLAAEAAFDAVFFGGGSFQHIDEPTTRPVLNNIPLGTGLSASRRYVFETGVRKPLVSGGQFTVSTDFSRSRNRTPGIEFSPDPAYATAVRLGFEQPLLRGFGSDVNTATIRLTRNLERRSVEELRSDVMTLLVDTERAYWNLVFAWRNVEIQQWLVDVGSDVRDVLDRRRDFDARLAEYADAVSTVEQRKANVIRARRQLRAASDDLKRLMNDPSLPVGSETVVLPVDDAAAAPISYSLRDAIATALSNRPELQIAALAIDDASIRQVLADNARLPLLNLTAEMSYLGLDRDTGDSYDELTDARFVNYLIGLAFEMPIGNRAAEADYRAARLQRSSAVIGYQRVMQEVIVDVKNALRDVVTNYELIQATRSFRVAQAENLRALLAREALVGLTPEFLNLKFQRQSTLAQAREQEILATIHFDQSVATLYRAMGVGLTMNRIKLEFPSEQPSGTQAGGHARAN